MPTDQRTKPLPFTRASVAELEELAKLYEQIDPTIEILVDPRRGEARVARLCSRCRSLHLLPEN